MKNLPRYLIVLFLIFTLPVSSEINDKDELREFLTDNGIKYIAEDGYDRIFSFNEKGEGTYYMGSNKKEMPLIWEVVNKNTLKSGHPKIVEQKGWTIMKIDFEKKKLHMDLSSINGEKYTYDITFTNSNTSKTEKTKSADSSLTKKDKNIKCKSNYRDNCIDILVDQNGTYEGEWVNNQRNGQGTQIFKNGVRYEGTWSNNKFHGKGTLTEKNGDYYTGEFKHNKEDGLGYFVWISGGKFSKYVGEWKNGKMHGHGKIHYRNGNVYVGNFNMGAFTDDQNLELSYFCKGMKCSKEEYERTQERENQKRSAYANVYSEFDNCPKIYDYLVTKMYTYSQNTTQYNYLKNLALETKKMIKTSGGYDSNSVSLCQDWMVMAIENTGGL
jgi:hypothetical protein